MHEYQIPIMVNATRVGAYTLTKHLTHRLASPHKAKCLDRAMHTMSQSNVIIHRVSYRGGEALGNSPPPPGQFFSSPLLPQFSWLVSTAKLF